MNAGRRKDDHATMSDLNELASRFEGIKEITIRLDERVLKFDLLITRLEKLEKSVNQIPWQVTGEKIKTLERFTWAAVVASIAAFVKALWTGG